MKKQMVKVNFGFDGDKRFGANVEDLEKEFNLFDFKDFFGKYGEYTRVDDKSLQYRIGKLLPEVKKDDYGYPMAWIGIDVRVIAEQFFITFNIQPC